MTAPWLCPTHTRAGLSADAPCCAEARAVETSRERRAWWRFRLDAKPRADWQAITYAQYDRLGNLRVLAEHAEEQGRTWGRGEAERGR